MEETKDMYVCVWGGEVIQWVNREQVCLYPGLPNPTWSPRVPIYVLLWNLCWIAQAVFISKPIWHWSWYQLHCLSPWVMGHMTKYSTWEKWCSVRFAERLNECLEYVDLLNLVKSQLLEVNRECWMRKSHFHLTSHPSPWVFPQWNVKPQLWPLVFIKVLQRAILPKLCWLTCDRNTLLGQWAPCFPRTFRQSLNIVVVWSPSW